MIQVAFALLGLAQLGTQSTPWTEQAKLFPPTSVFPEIETERPNRSPKPQSAVVSRGPSSQHSACTPKAGAATTAHSSASPVARTDPLLASFIASDRFSSRTPWNAIRARVPPNHGRPPRATRNLNSARHFAILRGSKRLAEDPPP